MSFSYWEHSSFLSNIDFAIVGAGIVGLNAALRLRQLHPTARIVVFERGVLPSGASSKNAGFACFGSASELLDDLLSSPADEVWALVSRRYEGLRRLRALLGDTNIDFQPLGNYELFAEQDADLYLQCLEALPELNAKMAEITNQSDVFRALPTSQIGAQGLNSQRVKQLIINSAEGQLHTGKLIRQLSKLAQSQDIDIFCGCTVLNIEEENDNCAIITEQLGTLSARQVLVTTNGFARQLLPELDVRPARNQVIVTQPIDNLQLSGCFHYDKGYIYFRNLPENRVLLGGGRNLDFEGETTYQFGETTAIQNYLRQFLRDFILPPQQQNIEIAHSWSGILGIGAVKKPIIQRLSPHVSAAVRLGGMGVAIGILVGNEGAELSAQGF
jgi:gamma-glutamylputrescine oxidase